MTFWSDLKDKVTTNPFGGVSFTDDNGKLSFSSVLHGIQGVSKGINEYFNKGKPVEFMGFNINEFRSSFVTDKDGGVARNNLFEVLITPPAALNSVGNKTAERLLARRIEAVDLPSKNINTTPVYTYGPARRIANGVMYNDMDICVILSESMVESLSCTRMRAWPFATTGKKNPIT